VPNERSSKNRQILSNISEMVQDHGTIVIMTDSRIRKSYPRFRLVPKPLTLDDLNGQNALWCRKDTCFGVCCTNLNEDRPTLAATKM